MKRLVNQIAGNLPKIKYSNNNINNLIILSLSGTFKG